MIKINENVLSNDLSPYLKQHKDNPVNWQTWSKEILEFSKQNKKPILLSTSGVVKIDNTKYKNFFKKKAKMLTANETLQITSHPIGGVCPFGLPNKLDIYYDKSLNNFDIVIPAAGSTNSSVKIQTKRLIELTSAFKVDVCKK